jgi:hypothetical protein
MRWPSLRRFMAASLAVLASAACNHNLVPVRDLTAFREAQIRSVLIVPAISKAVDVKAPDYFLTTIAKPLAERGYYVFPVHTVKRVLEEDGLADANMVHDADPTRLGELFGADGILYCTIEVWEARYIVLNTQLAVTFKLEMKSGVTGEPLWWNHVQVVYNTNQGGGGGLGGLIAQAIVAAIARADPNYIPWARQANNLAIKDLRNGLPPGPYFDEFANPNKYPEKQAARLD